MATPLGILDFGFRFGFRAAWVLHSLLTLCLCLVYLLARLSRFLASHIVATLLRIQTPAFLLGFCLHCFCLPCLFTCFIACFILTCSTAYLSSLIYLLACHYFTFSHNTCLNTCLSHYICLLSGNCFVLHPCYATGHAHALHTCFLI